MKNTDIRYWSKEEIEEYIQNLKANEFKESFPLFLELYKTNENIWKVDRNIKGKMRGNRKEFCNNLLEKAAYKGNLELVNFSLKHGANINSQDYYGVTALFSACKKKRFQVIETLLKNNADVNLATKKNTAPIASFFLRWVHDYEEAQILNVAKLLLEHKANVDGKCNGETVLMLSCSWAWRDFTKLLLDNKADINYSVMKCGYTVKGKVYYTESVWGALTEKYTCMAAKIGTYNEGIKTLEKLDDIAKMIIKTGELQFQRLEGKENTYYRFIKSHLRFEAKCEKDVNWLKSGKIILWDSIVKMLKYYIKNCTLKDKVYPYEIVEKHYSIIIANNADKVKAAIEGYLTKNWISSIFLSKGDKVLNLCDEEKGETKLDVPRPVLKEIGRLLFEVECKFLSQQEDVEKYIMGDFVNEN